jgi:hypothetical protein
MSGEGDRQEDGMVRRAGATRLLRAVSAVIAAGALLAASAVLPAAGAATPGPPVPSGFWTGEARASADTLTVGLRAANAVFGFTAGRSLAQYQDRTGSAEARALDLGALPVLFGGDQCDGSTPLLSAATLPPSTRADSGVAGSDASRRTEVRTPGIAGGPVGDRVGVQDATATPRPSSKAVTESAPLDVFLVALDGARTEVSTKLEGRVREARAVVTARQLRILGGLFTFENPRWEALTRSGDRNHGGGAFLFDRATVLGVPRTAGEVLADLSSFKRGLEQLLAPFGVVVDLPRVEPIDGGLRVTPMGFRVQNPPFGAEVLVPFLGRIDPLVQALREQAVRIDCRNILTLTVVDVLLGVVAGAGSAEVLAGGVEVSTRAVDYSVRPLEDTPLSEPEPEPPAVLDAGVALDDLGDTALDDLGAEPFTDTDTDTDFGAVDDAVDADVAVVDAEPVARTGRAREELALPSASTSSFEPGAAGRAAVAVGVVALLGAICMSMLDRLRVRRARRTIT